MWYNRISDDEYEVMKAGERFYGNNNKEDNEDGDDNRKPWDSDKKPPEDMQFPNDQNN